MRAFYGFLAAPIPSTLVFLVYGTFPHVYRPFFTENSDLPTLFVFCLAVAYGLIAAVGLPVFLLLRRLDRLTLPLVAAAGATIAANIPVAMELHRLATVRAGFAYSYFVEGCQIILSDRRTACGYELLFLDLIVFAVLGVGAALVFWLVYRARRPAA